MCVCAWVHVGICALIIPWPDLVDCRYGGDGCEARSNASVVLEVMASYPQFRVIYIDSKLATLQQASQAPATDDKAHTALLERTGASLIRFLDLHLFGKYMRLYLVYYSCMTCKEEFS